MLNVTADLKTDQSKPKGISFIVPEAWIRNDEIWQSVLNDPNIPAWYETRLAEFIERLHTIPHEI